MRTCVLKIVLYCFAIFRCSHSIRQLVTSSLSQSLVVSLLLPRMDYSSVSFTGLPRQNTICHDRCCMFDFCSLEIRPRRSSVTWPSLVAGHAVLAFRCQHGLASSYIWMQLHWVSNDESWRRLMLLIFTLQRTKALKAILQSKKYIYQDFAIYTVT